MTDTVLKEASDGILTITLNRPDALNAFTPEMLEGLKAALQAGADDPEVRVIVLRGAGRAFSAGVDLKVLQGIEPVAGKIGDVFDAVAADAAALIRQIDVPVIARVHGACFTGALEIALHCDFIYTTESTKFGDTHAKWGLRPTWGMSQQLARAVGVRRARELSFTARTFLGAEAAAWGLANMAAPDESVLDHVVTGTASEIAAASPGAVAAYKSLYRLHEQQLPLEEALPAELAETFPGITDTQERLGGFGR